MLRRGWPGHRPGCLRASLERHVRQSARLCGRHHGHLRDVAGRVRHLPVPVHGRVYNGDDSVYNVNDFQYQLYRPLYWFGTGATPYLNPALSLADPPIYRGHQVVIRLKQNYKWSNGEPVDAQDVVFWMNMMIAEGSTGAFWSPKGLPSDVTNVRAASKYVVTMDITTPQFSRVVVHQQRAQPDHPDAGGLGPDGIGTQQLRHDHLAPVLPCIST